MVYITGGYYLQELIGMLWKLMDITPEQAGYFLKIDKKIPSQNDLGLYFNKYCCLVNS